MMDIRSGMNIIKGNGYGTKSAEANLAKIRQLLAVMPKDAPEYNRVRWLEAMTENTIYNNTHSFSSPMPCKRKSEVRNPKFMGLRATDQLDMMISQYSQVTKPVEGLTPGF